jgi:hypothetical protein
MKDKNTLVVLKMKLHGIVISIIHKQKMERGISELKDAFGYKKCFAVNI